MSNDAWTNMLNKVGVPPGSFPDRMNNWLSGGWGDTMGEYEYKVNEDEELELWKGDKRVAMQSPEGSWFIDNIKTGTGSLHLGDLHSLGSGNENLVAVNHDSNIAWFPAWGGVTIDGATRYPVTARVHAARSATSPNGSIVNGSAVDYKLQLSPTTDLAFYYVEITPAEDYTGSLKWTVVRNTGKEVASFSFDAQATIGTLLKIPFKYPLWVKSGQVFDISLTKEDGTLLKVRAGSTRQTEPWRVTYSSTFVDHEVYHEGNLNMTASRALASDANGKVAASSTTLAELQNIRGAVTSSTVDIADADRFVHNDSGSMKQTSFTRVWAWIQGKASGAVSSVLTSNLAANRVLISDANGKIAATSTMSTAELQSIKAYKYIGGGGYSNKTIQVCSDVRGFTVWLAVTTTTIKLMIKNSSTSNVMGNGVISAGGDGSSDGGGWYENINAGNYEIESLIKGQTSDSSTNASKAGLLLFSVKGSSSTRHVALHYVMHNTDSDEYSVYCRVE